MHQKSNIYDNHLIIVKSLNDTVTSSEKVCKIRPTSTSTIDPSTILPSCSRLSKDDGSYTVGLTILKALGFPKACQGQNIK